MDPPNEPSIYFSVESLKCLGGGWGGWRYLPSLSRYGPWDTVGVPPLYLETGDGGQQHGRKLMRVD